MFPAGFHRPHGRGISFNSTFLKEQYATRLEELGENKAREDAREVERRTQNPTAPKPFQYVPYSFTLLQTMRALESDIDECAPLDAAGAIFIAEISYLFIALAHLVEGATYLTFFALGKLMEAVSETQEEKRTWHMISEDYRNCSGYALYGVLCSIGTFFHLPTERAQVLF